MTQFDIDRRQHPRFETDLSGIIFVDNQQLKGEIHNLSMGGLNLVVEDTRIPTATGINIVFKLPNGFRIKIAGTVMWCRPHDKSGRLQHGIKFYKVTERCEHLLNSYLDGRKDTDEVIYSMAQLSKRFGVEVKDGHLHIEMCGLMAQPDSQALCESICDVLDNLERPETLYVFLDMSTFAPQNEKTYEPIIVWVEKLKSFGFIIGLIAGRESTGNIIFNRLLREHGLGDSFMSIPDRDEALQQFLQLIEM